MIKNYKLLLFFLVSFGLRQNVFSSDVIRLNEGWLFKKGEPECVTGRLNYKDIKKWILPSGNAFLSKGDRLSMPAEELNGGEYTMVDFDDTSWRQLNIPHDWGIEEKFEQEYPGETGKLPWWGIAWYRKHLEIGREDIGKRVFLDFDGVMSFSTIWCNGRFVGGWPYGYTSFRVELTPYLIPGGKNVISVRVNNIKGSARWYPGGGIYRNVWLVKSNPVHIGQWGSKITVTDICTRSAKVNVNIKIANTDQHSSQVKVCTEIFHSVDGKPAGTKIISDEQSVVLSKPETHLAQTLILKSPRKWDIDSPHLYTAVVKVFNDGQLLDSYNTTFGIRTFEFKQNDGFHLNGHRVQIKGVCMHHDLGCLGTAVNVRAIERRLDMLKTMGVNAIRTSHNPPSPEFLDLCDKKGFLVIDEFVDVWLIAKQPKGYNILFEDWHEQDLRALIRRDQNHPCVIMWSIGNEVREQATNEGVDLSNKLKRIAKEEDSTRPVTGGCSNPDAGFHEFATTFDVFGFNYKPHLYKRFQWQNPNIPYYASETASCISTRGEYFFPVTDERTAGRSGFHISSYDLYGTTKGAYPPDVEFKAQEENPAIAGEFVWTGFDYLGEPSPFNSDMTVLLNFHTPEDIAKAEKELKELGKIRVPSRSSYFGIIDLAGFPKDRFYLYQSHWKPDLPMAHILPHWTWPGREGKITPVHVYTSGDAAELFINGESQGLRQKKKYEYRLRWDSVRYQPGTIKVIAYKNGKKWAEDCVKTADSPYRLLLGSDKTKMESDGEDLIFVTVKVVDCKNNLVPMANSLVRFEVTGPADIVGTNNGDPTSHESLKNKYIKTFNGLALVVLKSQKCRKGKVRLTATSDGLEEQSIELEAL